MPSTYTLNNGIELISTGEQSGTWGDTTNTNLSLVDAALDGQVTVTLSSAGSSGSPNDLPISDGVTSNGRNRIVIFNDGSDLGATAYVQLTPNDAEKIIYVRNSLSGSRSIILFQGTYSASNDYEVPAGTTAVVFFDGAGSGAVAANVFNNAYFDSLRLGSVSVTAILDEDNMSSNSATALATQQSIKSYVDTQVGANNELSEVLANGNTTGSNNIVVNNGQAITTNTVSETTSGSGVTIDSVLLKDDGVNATNLEVTNLKANDGTAAGSIANSTGAFTITSLISNSVDIGGGAIDGTVIGGSTPAAISGTTGSFTGDLTVDSTTLHVDSTNNRVGIGTTSPGRTLDVQDASGDADIRLLATGTGSGDDSILYLNIAGTSATSRVNFGDSDDADRGRIIYSHSSDYMSFTTSATEQMRIDSDGVDVTGNVSLRDNDELRFGDSDDLVIKYNGTNGTVTNDAGHLYLTNTANDNDVVIQSDDGSGGVADYFRADGSTGQAKLFSYGAQKLTTHSWGVEVSGSILADQSVSIVSADPYIKLTDTSTGVDHEIDANSGVGNLVINADINGEGSDPKLLLKVSGTTGITVRDTGNVAIAGALSKGSGSFKIDHPLKPTSHHLVHSFVEAPQADNIYRGKVTLSGGSATANLDEAGRMTAGTFVALNGNIQCFTTNEDGWTAVRGSVSGNTLTIEAQDSTCADTVSWLVIGERHDPHMLNTNWTDEAGRVITEPEKQPEEEE